MRSYAPTRPRILHASWTAIRKLHDESGNCQACHLDFEQTLISQHRPMRNPARILSPVTHPQATTRGDPSATRWLHGGGDYPNLRPRTSSVKASASSSKLASACAGRLGYRIGKPESAEFRLQASSGLAMWFTAGRARHCRNHWNSGSGCDLAVRTRSHQSM